MVFKREGNQWGVRNLCVGLLLAVGSTACATNSLSVTKEAAPITYKIDGEGGQYASLRKNVSLSNQNIAPVQRRSGLTQSQVQQPRVAAPQIVQTPNTKFDPNSVDKQLYAHQSVRKPYTIKGKEYTPKHQPNYDKTGLASWYGPKFNGKPTASGEIFDKNDLTAAHKTLPLNSMVHVTNLENGRSLMVRVNDRGPFVGNRIIDLSEASAKALGTIHNGLAKVRVRYAGPADTNAPKRMYQEPVSRPSAPAPLVAERPQVTTPAPRPQLTAPTPRPTAPTQQAENEYLPLRQLGGQPSLPLTVPAPQPEQVSEMPAPAPVYEAPTPAPVYQVPAPVTPAPVAPDRHAPVTTPRPDAGGNVTLTIKGPIHMATQDDDAPKPKWIPAVNRVTTTR